MERQTHGGTVYGPGYAERFVTPDNLRRPLLRRRGLFRRWYAAKDVARLLDLVATDIEKRQRYEDGLLVGIRQLGEQYEAVKLALQQWQSDWAREVWEMEHPTTRH